MKKRKIAAFLLCTAMIGTGLSGCGSDQTEQTETSETSEASGDESEEVPEESGKPEKITIISTTDDVGYFEYIGGQYTEEYGVEVEIISQAYDDTKTKITTSVTSGNADIAYLDVVWPAEFADKGLILPLDEYYTDEMRENLLQGNIDQMSAGGKVYGVPFCNNGTFMYYNKAMLGQAGYDAPPETWDELKEMSVKMQSEGICKYGIAWPGLQAEGSICNMSTLLCSFGGEWVDDQGDFAFHSDEGVQAIEFMTGSIQDGWADPSSVSYSDRDILDAFLAGDTAFVTNWSYAYNVANDPAQSQVAGDVDVCLVPGANGTTSAFATGGGGLGILSTSKSPEYAWKFIEKLADAEIQKYGFENFTMMPTLKAVFEDPEVQALDPSLEKMYPQFEYPANRPAVPNYSEWSNILQVELSSIMIGNEDAKTGLDQAYDQVKDFLK